MFLVLSRSLSCGGMQSRNKPLLSLKFICKVSDLLLKLRASQLDVPEPWENEDLQKATSTLQTTKHQIFHKNPNDPTVVRTK